MSQLVLDDQLDLQKILPALEELLTMVRLQDLRPGEHILDDRVPPLLLNLKRPTFVTIDHGFWKRKLCHPKYCILFFDLHKDKQEQLPALLRKLFRLPEFRTRSARMGKVARISKKGVTYWEDDQKVKLDWPDR